MKKINFNELCDLVAHVDYLWENTFPINFSVDGTEYLVGIGNYDCGDGTGDELGVFGLTEELQYLMRFNDDGKSEYIDVQDPDQMVYEEIVEMLKKQCNITDNSEICLYDVTSFDGSQDYTVEWELCSDEVQRNALEAHKEIEMETETISFDKLHELVSEVDYINEESYPIAFTVDGVKYRVGIGDFVTDDIEESEEDFTDFFYGYENEIQYLNRIEECDGESEFDAPIGECVLDAVDPDGMSFKGIGEMIKKCCNVTETSEIKLYPYYSFNGRKYGVFWMELSDEVISNEKENIRQWKNSPEYKECLEMTADL